MLAVGPGRERRCHSEAEVEFRAEPVEGTLTFLESSNGSDDPDPMLAESLLEEGRDSEALPYFMQALRIRERALGPDHRDVAITLSNITRIHGRPWLTSSRTDTSEPSTLAALP